MVESGNEGFTSLEGFLAALSDSLAREDVRLSADRYGIVPEIDRLVVRNALAWLAEQQLDLGDECQVRRVIASGGRSRAYLNGSPVPLQQLREFGERLVDIHGQHEHQSLMKRDLQRQLLDHHGGHQSLLAALAALRHDWKQTGQQIDAIIGG